MGAQCIGRSRPALAHLNCGLEHTSRVQIEDFRDLDLRRQKPLSNAAVQTGGSAFWTSRSSDWVAGSRKRRSPVLLGADPERGRRVPRHSVVPLEPRPDLPGRFPADARQGLHRPRAYLDDAEIREFGALHFGLAPRRVQVTDPSTACCSTWCAARCRTQVGSASLPAPPRGRVRRRLGQ